MITRNRKDDLEIAVTIYDWKGEAIGVPDFDWMARFTTNGITHYDAQCVGGVYTNAYVKHDADPDTDGIVCVLNNHGLGCGKLKCEFRALLPNSNYPDGNEMIYTPLISDIVLTDGESSKPSALDITATLPYIKGEQGDAMTWEKMSDSEKQEVVDGAVAKLQPQVDESLAKVQTDAENVMQQVKNDTNAAVKQADTDVTNAISELTEKTEDVINGVNANTQKAIDDMNAASEETINKVNSDTADAIKSVTAQTETAISNLNTSVTNALQEFETTSQEKLEEWEAYSESAKSAEEAREERSLSGSFSVDFGTEALTATWFNVEGYKVVITAVQSANCASVTINGTADAVGLEVAAESVAVVEITRAAEGVSAAVGVKYKLVKE